MPKAATTRRRRSVNLTVPAELIADAKALGVNASQAASAGIAEAVKRAREKEWLKQSGPAIEAYNERIRKHGPALGWPEWAKD
jgi:antitoxin CcdA